MIFGFAQKLGGLSQKLPFHAISSLFDVIYFKRDRRGAGERLPESIAGLVCSSGRSASDGTVFSIPGQTRQGCAQFLLRFPAAVAALCRPRGRVLLTHLGWPQRSGITCGKFHWHSAARCLNTKAARQFSANLPLPGEMKLTENAPFADDVPMKLICCSATW